MDAETILKLRKEMLGRNLSISYRDHLHIVRGEGQYLYAKDGKRYLDLVNNVAHVGHCHPRVTAAASAQLATLNTNTRYLHEGLVAYAQQLLATFPDPLAVVYFTCTGSEANELALRLARTYTGREDVIVVDGAYHGNTNALIDMSPYKFGGPGGRGKRSYVSVVRAPDVYYDPAHNERAGEEYAESVREQVEKLRAAGRAPAAFFCESILGCGGQVVLPKGYLRAAFKHVREAGGACVVDEVQTGFGRVGSHFWGFQMDDAVPDIVTMGKPIGNGFPLGAVVTTRAIADAFHNGMEYFNTFGGSTAACAVGKAVLDVIFDEKLQENARRVGGLLKRLLTGLMTKHPLVGDVRGAGLFLGMELVTSRKTRAPAHHTASAVANAMRERHQILISTDGPRHNVMKIKPPIVITEDNAREVALALDEVLTNIEAEGGVGGEGVGELGAAAAESTPAASRSSARPHLRSKL